MGRVSDNSLEKIAFAGGGACLIDIPAYPQEAPTEIIISVLTSMLTFMFTPTTIPFFHRFGRITQRRSLVFLVFLTGLMMAIFSARSAYDAEHPKRLGVQYVHNVRLGVVPYDLLKTLALTSSRLWHADQVTSGENHLHMAQMDRGPGFQDILQRLHDRYGLPHHPLTPNPRSDDNSDWDVLYPISAFLETEMFELGVSELNPGRTLPEMQIDLVHDEWHEEEGVRSIALRVQHVSGSSCAKSRMRVSSGFTRLFPPDRPRLSRNRFLGRGAFLDV
jgi:hypothetical protein